MPTGCDFICENEKCEYYNTKLQLNNTWPIAIIDKVINSKKIKGTEFEMNFVKRKQSGIKYACISFPNEDIKLYDGARLERFCPKCFKRIHSFIIFPCPVSPKSFDKVFIREFKKMKVESKCLDCGTKLFDFQKVLKKGVGCPKCKVETKQHRWFC